jgi:hypothetical protein
VLDHVMHKLEVSGETFYWKDCILAPDMKHGEQGYMVVFSNGEQLHTYHYPPDFLGKS